MGDNRQSESYRPSREDDFLVLFTVTLILTGKVCIRTVPEGILI